MKFEVKFDGQYNTRIASTYPPTKDERFINCYLTKHGGENYIVKRPGFGVSNTPSSGNVGTAIMTWTGSGAGTSIITAFTVSGNSRIYNGTSSLGNITGVARSIAETQVWPDVTVAPTPTLIVPSSDSTAWYYDSVVATMTKITDGSFPGNAGYTTVGDFAVLRGFACIMTSDQKLWASNLNSVKNWTANSYDTASSFPDAGIGVVRFRNYLMAFGTGSIQFYQASGGTPFPFSVVDHLTQKIGAVSSDAIASLSDYVFWCGTTNQGGVSIFQYDGNLSRISTQEQDISLALAGAANISLTTIRFQGRSFVVVNTPNSTFVYCIDDKRWHEWSGTVLWYKATGLQSGSSMLTYTVSSSTSGRVFAASGWTDDSSVFTATIQSKKQEADGRMMFFSFLRVIADIEPGASTLTVYSTDDDYTTWTTHGTINLTSSNNFHRLDRLGASRSRAWKITQASNGGFRIRKLVGEMDLGS